MFEYIVIVVALSLVSAAVGAFLLSPYNNAGTGAVLGLLLGPFGALIAALMAVTEELKKQSELTLRLATEAAAEDTNAAEEKLKEARWSAASMRDRKLAAAAES
jgi:hypothetical protein